MAYVANRYPHVRAAVAWSPEIAELARKHNDANVLVLPSRFVSEEEGRSEEHTSELQSQSNLVCRLLLEKKKKKKYTIRASNSDPQDVRVVAPCERPLYIDR